MWNGSSADSAANWHRFGTVPTVAAIWLIAGTLDITENLIFNHFRGITPQMVFRYIASGLIGQKSFRGGMPSIALGVALHYLIALIWTLVFYAARRQFAMIRHRPVLSGLLYGAFVYLFMNFVVLPLSAVPHAGHASTLASLISGVLALLLCIGLTISLLFHRYCP